MAMEFSHSRAERESFVQTRCLSSPLRLCLIYPLGQLPMPCFGISQSLAMKLPC